MNYSSRRLLLVNVLLWTGLATLNVLSGFADAVRSDTDFEWLRQSILFAFAYLPWMLVTPILFTLLQHAVDRGTVAIMRLFTLALIAWGPVYVFIDTAVFMWFQGRPLSDAITEYGKVPGFFLLFDLLLFFVTFGGCLAVIYFQRMQQQKASAIALASEKSELELKLSELRMQGLKSQLEPHFLFNALNTISAMVRTHDARNAQIALNRLSELLRYAVNSSREHLVTLAAEKKFVEDYVELQLFRFGEKLQVTMSWDDRLADLEIPPFTLQTFIENTIRHCLEVTGEAYTIRIDMGLVEKQLLITVCNTPAGPGNDNGLGIGLENMRQRLEIIYGQEYELVTDTTAERFCATLKLPADSR